jgi:3-hydroxyisobutyrate dehydrogenase
MANNLTKAGFAVKGFDINPAVMAQCQPNVSRDSLIC